MLGEKLKIQIMTTFHLNDCQELLIWGVVTFVIKPFRKQYNNVILIGLTDMENQNKIFCFGSINNCYVSCERVY